MTLSFFAEGARRWFWPMLAVAAFTSACAPMWPAPPARPVQPVVVAVSQLSEAERMFMTRIAASGLYELEVSRLAASRATFPAVRTYAQMLAGHHEKANQELAALMRAKGVEPPAGLAADKATKLYRLSALRPSAEFDRGYVRVVGVEDHTASVALFEQAQRDVRDRDLRAWIDRTLPVLRTHLDSARALSSALAG